METINNEALNWLMATERIYSGTNRHEMKLALKSYVENCHKDLLECCPLYTGLVMVSALKMLDECPDYF